MSAIYVPETLWRGRYPLVGYVPETLWRGRYPPVGSAPPTPLKERQPPTESAPSAGNAGLCLSYITDAALQHHKSGSPFVL